ncbi:LuxR family transcriptional regulator [Streptomyces eurocidicus]|uniref:DNA-binding NarL/FixJ family response regulator n=1 Tax=Streptomyces eurocidicus TaxID=66423 RepID=A0A2N8P0V7_STREU|nr:response regulator transcription factor [Streptomyces eurocidicus]MBB5121764.1 DNA-binding NarL/FixJ family response regulator [Streptomyces eurocidicus]MBF6055032.1 response regulator [Streptomyces eurocidicus]PNE34648.1 LuxR family transcriptional regulator [Streptomyces eurocidicus]
MIRVLVTDDEPLVRFGLRMLLDAAEDIVVVGEAADGAEALARARELAPDLVLTDLRMPGMDGITATKQLLALPNPPAVLVLTTFDTEEGVTTALEAGAAGYLLKDAPPEQVVGAVRLVASGGTVLASASAARLLEASRTRSDGAQRIPAEQRRRLESLGPQQRDILRLLGSGMPNAQIAQRMYLTEGTVKAYVSRLLTTLKLENRTQAAILAHQAGLLDEQ